MKTFVEEYSNKFNGASGDMITLYDAAKFTSELLKQERNNAINEAISTIGFMLGRMTYEQVIERFESELESLKT